MHEFDDRWDEQATEHLPEHLRGFYLNILSSTNGIEEALKFQNNKGAELVKELVMNIYIRMVHRCMHQISNLQHILGSNIIV